MIIHMENTFKAMQCNKCRKYFKKKQESQIHLQKSTLFFLFLDGDLKILHIFYKIQNLNSSPIPP